MGVGPGLVIRGTLLGSILVAVLGFFLTAGAVPLAEAAPVPTSAAQAASAETSQGSQPAAPAQAEQPKSQVDSGECKVSSRFPEKITKWCDLITRYAEDRGLEPELVASVMLQESGGDPVAYSHSGAVGLLQVMPRDGLAASFACASGPCFASRPTIAELQDPEFNIKYGTGMLANLLNKYGNIRDALAAYGPRDVGYYYADKVLAIFDNYGK